jgi:LemA protein
MKKFAPILILLVVVVAAVGWYFSARNGLVAQDESINGAEAEIDNQLKRRADLIPNLVNTVKGYAAHEEGIFKEVSDARARMMGAGTMEEKAAAYNEMGGALSRLLAVAEAYPELKANTNFQALQDELAGTENRIAVARQRYNDAVRSFNTKVRSFPASIVAGNLGFSPRQYFEIADSDRANVQVTF